MTIDKASYSAIPVRWSKPDRYLVVNLSASDAESDLAYRSINGAPSPLANDW